MFADNTKIFRTLKIKSDREILQADLDNLNEWSNRWRLTFNTSKCKIVKDNPKFQYTMTTENNTIVLAETVQEKDLCIWISNNLKWEKQVVAATQQGFAFSKKSIYSLLSKKRLTLFQHIY